MFLLLLYAILLEMKHQFLEFGEEILDGIIMHWDQGDQLIFELVTPHLISFSNQRFQLHSYFIWSGHTVYMKEKVSQNAETKHSKLFIKSDEEL